MPSNRCKENVFDRTTKRYRKCKNNKLTYSDYCSKHYNIMTIGICCFCNEKCNPMSQCCGRCARNLRFW